MKIAEYEKRCCGTCRFHKFEDGEWICDNPDCDAYPFKTEYQDGEDCKEWEVRKK